jgi:hypothetical protein
MNPEPQRTCPSCGNEFSGAMEFCPVCMLRKGLAGGVESSESSASEEAVNPTPEQPAQRFEHYELVAGEDGKPVELGRGAMGVTYKAFDINLRCPVTLKVISERYLGDESARLRFLREARAAASVRHPNVASVFHLGTIGQNYFYAMEYVEGETLERLIKRSGRLEIKLALEIASQVAAGLAAVHEQNLVHRDIKPTNIMVRLKDGGAATVKIIDLGLAKPVNELGSQTAISMPGGFAGTPEFASPEQFAGVGVNWFGEGPELSVLRMLGLFDRPAVEKALGALLKPPAIRDLTESLTDFSPTEWRTLLAKLRRAKLIAGEDPHHPGDFDTHPLVREYFGEQLQSQRTETWKECNRRLYDYYRTLAPHLPDSFKEMEPLFLAVICGCNAGLFREALHEVYIPRIQRGDASFAADFLGARGALLSVLASFFEHGHWGSPVATK